MIKKRKVISSVAYVLICMVIISVLCPLISSAAEETQNKTVRVAYVVAAGYQEGKEGEHKTGYGYEYLQKIAEINGWHYEYIYGDFSDLLSKLEKGEIDLMGNLSYTEERAEKISFGSYEQGREVYHLYAKKANKEIDPLDYSTLNGMRIATTAGSYQLEAWKEWCTEHQVICENIEYNNSTERKNALNHGDVDATIGGNVQLDDETADWQVLFNFATSPFYFGVNKNRPDILEELNRAQKEILDEDPFYNEEVHDRYMEQMSLVTTDLNEKEENWLKEHDYHIKFGYLKGFPPLCYQDENGEFKGVAADLFAVITEKYADKKIQFDTVAYEDYYTMFDDLRSGKISVAWPAYNDYWNAEESNFSITNHVVETSMRLVYDGKYTDQTATKIGVFNTGSLSKIYAGIYYPESEICEYDSYESAIQAVLDQEVSSVLYVSTTYNVDIAKNKDLRNLNAVRLSDSFGISFAVSKNDRALISLLNKGIIVFGESGVNHSLVTNSTSDQELTLKEYFDAHPYYGALLIIIILGVAAGIIIFVVYKNMSFRVKASQAEKQAYEELSNSDILTGLYNRKAVFRKCKKLLEEHPDKQFAMIHFDVVRFRLFNTFFGDEAGDKLLCDIADVIRGFSRDYDDWAYGRIEADVFCAFVPFDQTKYQKHVDEMCAFFKEYRSDFLVEPKMGVYLVTDREMPIEAMFTRATMASKEAQANSPYATVVYDEKLERRLNDSQEVINEMQTAIDQEQFKVYLQPKYSLRNNKPVGAEALVRWIHPTKGLISPDKFIPVFEGNGFITVLDRYMWEHVCRLLKKWKEEGKPLIPVSVNVSRLSIYGSTTVDFLKSLVKKYDIDPKYLELELTESAYMDDPEEMQIQMKALKDAGFTILLDDFGSGYSSLNTLRELPVDILKLDMKFLSQDNSDIRGALVISSIIRMSKLLKLVVVAEGVEKQEQADYLKGIGCEFVQGFLFARPMPAEDYEKLLSSCEEPLIHVNQPVMEHIGKIIAETGSVTYAMGTVLPLPLAYLEYADGEFEFMRVNPRFFEEFKMENELGSAAEIFKKHLTGESFAQFVRTMEKSGKAEQVQQVPVIWNSENGMQKKYMCTLAYEGSFGNATGIVVTFTNI